eukprot:5421863-Pleurochrysis_carterae.AAC.1
MRRGYTEHASPTQVHWVVATSANPFQHSLARGARTSVAHGTATSPLAAKHSPSTVCRPGG